MDMRSIIAASLAAVPLTACPSTWNCNPPEEAFDDAWDTPAGWLRDAGVEPGATPSAEQCETVCRTAYYESRGWQASVIDDCQLSVYEDRYDDASPADRVVGQVVCEGTGIEFYCEGRRPLGHVEAAGVGGDDLGRVLATLAHLEAASVLAFAQLAELLSTHHAPADLVRRCRRAADDERRHAAWLGVLAQQRGATVPRPRAEPAAVDLRTVALHNAVEGCVHEAWAALEAAVAAERAPDAALRRAWARIAADEAAHAQLSWDLHDWLCAQLSADERARVQAARTAALRALPGRAATVADQAHPALGFPSVDRATALAVDFAGRLAA